jgi:hypothetical protein
MKRSECSTRFNSDRNEYEISLKSLGEDWHIKLGTAPDGIPNLWIKTKNMDYSSYEETLSGHELGLEELIGETEISFGLDAAERQRRAADRNDRAAARSTNRRRLVEGLDRILGGYRS